MNLTLLLFHQLHRTALSNSDASIPQFISSVPKLLSWQAGVSNYILCPFYNTSVWTTQKTQPLYFCGGVFIAPLHSKDRGADHIENTALLLLSAFISAGICVLNRCLEINVYSGSASPAFKRHVTLLYAFHSSSSFVNDGVFKSFTL
jgi:hypothetical protein